MHCFSLLAGISGLFSPDSLLSESKTAYINGKIYTVDKNKSIAEAVITAGNRIIFTGSTAEAKKITDSKTKIIDLHGKLMLPGFIDNHVHFRTGGNNLPGIKLRHAKSLNEFRTIIKDYSLKHPGVWITDGEWDQESWNPNRLPVKEDIDDITPNQPVFVTRFDQHIGLANSAALKLAGITKDTPSPDGGLIEMDPVTGEPTGIIIDNAIPLITKFIPEDSEEKLYQKALLALQEAARLGLTSVQDISVIKDFRVYQKLEKDNKLTCRIYSRPRIFEYKEAIKLSKEPHSDKLKIGSVKAFADGSLGAMSAWFYEPYTQDPTTCGLPNELLSNGKLKEWSLEADRNGLQLSIHAIGDRANAAILDMFSEIKKTNPEWDRRFRIEHVQHIKAEDIKRCAELGVIASVQPYHQIEDGVWAEKRVGPERIKEMYTFKSFIDAGIKVCFGSDWVVAPLNPLTGIYAAVTRRTLDGKNPDGWLPEQKISVEQAIECYTINNAWASFDENIKGSIEPGKLADMVILEEDILTIDPERIKDVKVYMTIMDGTAVYTKTGNGD
jgi:predicted amidohydrolase YtcJ